MADQRRVISASSPSWRYAGQAVKPGAQGSFAAPSGRLIRHFEGWQLGLLSVGIAVLGVFLALPREVPPDVLPLPRVDRSTVRLERAEEHARAEEARARPLPFEIRSVGERFRRYGRAAATRDEARANAELVELTRTVAAAKSQHGAAPLLALRAVQGELFARALGRWEATGQVDDELIELGGDFVDKAKASGWLTAPHNFVASSDERGALFRIRWANLTGLLATIPFSPTLDEWRVYYRFLLEHPEIQNRDCSPVARATTQLRYVAALGKKDPEYPASLARGVLELRRGAPASAMTALIGYLEGGPKGPWSLRARNYLATARARVNDPARP
jgi:hypothetical protein